MDDRVIRQRVCEQLPHCRGIDEAVRQRIACARPLTTERRGKTEPHQRAALRRCQRPIHQLKQAILAKAQVGIELLTEGSQIGQSRGFEHPASFAPAAPSPVVPFARLGSYLSKPE